MATRKKCVENEGYGMTKSDQEYCNRELESLCTGSATKHSLFLLNFHQAPYQNSAIRTVACSWKI